MKLIAKGDSQAPGVPDKLRHVAGQCRGYASPGDRSRAIAMLVKRGFNHFVCYRDVQSRFALMIGWTAWAIEYPYIDW